MLRSRDSLTLDEINKVGDLHRRFAELYPGETRPHIIDNVKKMEFMTLVGFDNIMLMQAWKRGSDSDATGLLPCSRYRELVKSALMDLKAASELDREYQGDMCAESFREGIMVVALSVVSQLEYVAEKGR